MMHLRLAYSSITAKDKVRAALDAGGLYYHPLLWTAEYERATGELIADGAARWGTPEDPDINGMSACFYLLPVRQPFNLCKAWAQIAALAVFVCAFWGFVLYWLWGR